MPTVGIAGTALVPTFMKSGPVRDFWSHTTRLADAAGMANARDFDLMSIHRLAPDIMICDVDIDTCRHRLRFVGTRIVAMFGEETTGRYLDEVYLGPFRSQQLAAFNLAVASGCAQWTRTCAAVSRDIQGKPAGAGNRECCERLVVPLCGEDQVVVQLAAITRRAYIVCKSEAFEHQEVLPAYMH